MVDGTVQGADCVQRALAKLVFLRGTCGQTETASDIPSAFAVGGQVEGSPLTRPQGPSVGSVGSPLLAGILNFGH